MNRRQPASVAFATCPDHVADGTARNAGLTGLIAITKNHHVFRDHTKRVGKTTIACPDSGKTYQLDTD